MQEVQEGQVLVQILDVTVQALLASASLSKSEGICGDVCVCVKRVITIIPEGQLRGI